MFVFLYVYLFREKIKRCKDTKNNWELPADANTHAVIASPHPAAVSSGKKEG
jgi:hypothetical protein